jgi:hypothetical protein
VRPLADVPGEAAVNAEAAIQTVGGRRVQPLEAAPGDIDLEDVAHALSNLCRFGGHTRVFFSVAQHSCLVADAVAAAGGSPEETLWALLHDAAEAYLGDLAHPLKHSPYGDAYRVAEERLQAVVCARFGLAADTPARVKRVDRSLLASERLALMADAWEWPELAGVDPLDVEIEPWSPERARREFLERFERLRP